MVSLVSIQWHFPVFQETKRSLPLLPHPPRDRLVSPVFWRAFCPFFPAAADEGGRDGERDGTSAFSVTRRDRGRRSAPPFKRTCTYRNNIGHNYYEHRNTNAFQSFHHYMPLKSAIGPNCPDKHSLPRPRPTIFATRTPAAKDAAESLSMSSQKLFIRRRRQLFRLPISLSIYYHRQNTSSLS